MNSTNIDTLFLDIGGVLLTNGWAHQLRRKAAKQFGLDYDDMDDRHSTTFDTYELGRISLDTYLRRVVFYQPRDFSLDEFKQFMFAQSQPFPQTIELFRQLKMRFRLRVAAVSNEGRELTELRIHRFDLTKLIDFFVCSCFVHRRKPDEEMYRLALDTMQATPARTLYVDDRAQLAEVARGLGLQTIHHRGHDSTLAALAEHGLALEPEDTRASQNVVPNQARK